MPRIRNAKKASAKASTEEACALSHVGSNTGHIGHFDFDYILRPPTCPNCGQNFLCCNCSGHKKPAPKHEVVDVSNPVKHILEACTQVRIPTRAWSSWKAHSANAPSRSGSVGGRQAQFSSVGPGFFGTQTHDPHPQLPRDLFSSLPESFSCKLSRFTSGKRRRKTRSSTI